MNEQFRSEKIFRFSFIDFDTKGIAWLEKGVDTAAKIKPVVKNCEGESR